MQDPAATTARVPQHALTPFAGGWHRIDLTDDQYAEPPQPPTTLGLLYQGKRHVISGPPESTKTLIAYIAVIETVREGHNTAIIDFEMGAAGARRLLDDLGITTDELERIYFVAPDSAPADELQAVIAFQPALVVIDAAAGAYDVQGLDDNKRQDAETFARAWIKPLWDAGITTLLIDHVVKNTETRGKFTIGSERKVGQADVHLGLDVVKALTRGNKGILKVHVHKDRQGFLERPTAAIIELHSDPDTHVIAWSIKPYEGKDPDTGEFRPTALMEKASRHLEQLLPEGTSRNDVEKSVVGKAEWLRTGLDILTREGFITESKGARRARIVTSKTPYRQPPDDFVPTSSHFVPDEHTTTSSHLVPPLQGDRGLGRGQLDDWKSTTSSPEPDDDELQRLINLYGPTA